MIASSMLLIKDFKSAFFEFGNISIFILQCLAQYDPLYKLLAKNSLGTKWRPLDYIMMIVRVRISQ
jgi:hypothetical protein